MSYLALARKYRPQTFSDVVGQGHIVQTLSNAISASRIAHAYVFIGPRGVGKTSIARIYAKSLNCEKGPTPTPCGECASCKGITDGNAIDYYEIDAASNSKVDETRILIENAQYLPTHSRYKIYVIDEVHMLSTASFNALLKTLEEPPAHVIFILATTEAHKIPETILSRCQRFIFRRMTPDDISAQLSDITASEGKTITSDALFMIAQAADGSMRDAQSLLDQIMAYADNNIDESHVSMLTGAFEEKIARTLIDMLSEKEYADIIAYIQECETQGIDYKNVFTKLTALYRDMLVIRSTGNSTILFHPAQLQWLSDKTKSYNERDLVVINDILTGALNKIRYIAEKRIFFEITLFKIRNVASLFAIDTAAAPVRTVASPPQKTTVTPAAMSAVSASTKEYTATPVDTSDWKARILTSAQHNGMEIIIPILEQSTCKLNAKGVLFIGWESNYMYQRGLTREKDIRALVALIDPALPVKLFDISSIKQENVQDLQHSKDAVYDNASKEVDEKIYKIRDSFNGDIIGQSKEE